MAMRAAIVSRFFFLLACMLVCVSVAAQSTRPVAASRFMFCIGINNYLAGANPATCQVCKDRGIKNLNGCLNDVDTISKLFIKYYGFKPENITQLKDQAASRAAILQKFDQLLAQCKKGDAFVFFYSGHGSYEYETAGDEQLKTGKGYRNTILPADIIQPGVQDFNSAELNKIFSGFTDKGVVVTVITDCCHSATNTRGSTFFEADTAREVRPSLEPGKFITEATTITRQLDASGALTIGSCQDNEIASEAKMPWSAYYGAFTISLCRSVTEWSQAPIDVLLNRTISKLRLLNKLQTPSMEASKRLQLNLAGTAPAQERKTSWPLKCMDCSANKQPVIAAGFTDDILNDDILVDTKTKDSIRISNVGLTETEVSVINQNKKLKATDLMALSFTILKRLPNPDPPLKIYIGNAVSPDSYKSIVEKAAAWWQQQNLSYQWMNPSLQAIPDAVLFYRNGWKLNRNGITETITFNNPDATDINSLMKTAKLRNAYVQLPPPTALVDQLMAKLPAAKNRNIKIVDAASAADFMLAGHLINNGNNIAYGWEKTIQATSNEEDEKGLPAVTDFFSSTADNYMVDSLTERLKRVSVLANWLSMKSPPADQTMIFPFHLAIINTSNQQKADDINAGASGTADKLDIGIEKDAASKLRNDKITPLFVYVMSMDPKGKTYLLYPQPRSSILTYPNSLWLDTSFYHLATVRHTTPGSYHYFFIALREPVSSRDIFTREGVVKGDAPEYSDNPLEALLNDEGAGQRGEIKSFDHWMLKTVNIITTDKPVKKK